MFNKKRILITGGTGSFGKKFVDVVLKKYNPAKLVIFSRDEFKQYQMREIFDEKKYSCLRYILGDVRDNVRLTQALRDIDYVIHAAALKQVPAAEYNPMEFIKTNVHGAENVVAAAIENKVKKVIVLSTDKAANPINLYGSTKLVSDKIFTSANNITGFNLGKRQKTIFSVVRYGNVIGSRGSVVPLFKDIIAKNKKFFPITHKDMTRFWITLDQGVNFVLRMMKIMEGSEIFVPKLPSTKIIDLAKALDSKKPFKIIGIRPGEKIHEIMTPKETCLQTFEFKNHYVIYKNPKSNNYKYKDKSGEIGVRVKEGFEYSSENNKNFLTIKQIKKLDYNS
jgi:UDP-N-acetylglucosamine 4,6-dehydratase